MANAKISALTAATTPLAGTEVLPIVQSSTTKKVAVSDLTAGRAVSAATLSATQYASGDTLVQGTNSASGGFAVTRFAHYINVIDGDYISAYNIGSGNNDGMMQLLANAGRNGTPGTVKLAIGLDAPNGAAITAAIGTASNHPLSFGVNSAEVARFNTSGNLVFKTAGKGIDFSANSHAAGMTSELLTWYEEGTWTPTFTCGTSGTITVGSATGTYTRIGRLVTIEAYLSVSSVSSPVGNLILNGLPFTKANNNVNAISVWGAGFTSSATTSLIGYVVANTKTAYIQTYAAGNNAAAASYVQAGTEVRVTATYQV